MNYNNYLKAIILENCPYSIALDEMLNNYNIPFKKIFVNHNNKEDYKTTLINTFPQLYLIINKKEYLIGGYSISKEVIDNIKHYDNLNIIKKNVKKNLPHFNNKNILRLIKLIIS